MVMDIFLVNFGDKNNEKNKIYFLAVATMLVTAFYIINIQPKSQDIIAYRLPKGVLVANNAEQNPNHIPSNQEVLVALDNYAKTLLLRQLLLQKVTPAFIRNIRLLVKEFWEII